MARDRIKRKRGDRKAGEKRNRKKRMGRKRKTAAIKTRVIGSSEKSIVGKRIEGIRGIENTRVLKKIERGGTAADSKLGSQKWVLRLSRIKLRKCWANIIKWMINIYQSNLRFFNGSLLI